MELSEVITGLKAWFKPEEHKTRDLPGGGKWYYVPWQTIRERLDVVCPEWEVSYGEPSYIGDYCQVSCTITILGKSRQAIGNAPVVLLSSSGKDMARGTPIERAVADAFKNAAEAWGCCRYLDEQADNATKAEFVRYMQRAGRGDVALNYHKNEGNIQGDRPKVKTSRSSGIPPTAARKKPVAPSSDSLTMDMKALQARIEGLCSLLGCTVPDIDRLAQEHIKKSVLVLDESEVRRLRAIALIEWAALSRAEQGLGELNCGQEWTRFCQAVDPTRLSDDELFTQWKSHIMQIAVGVQP